MTLTFGSLFAGIGGFDLGFEQAGLHCAWQVEIDARCNEVLAYHWPDVKRYGDVRDVGKHNLETVDIITGGFPCQGLSVAGRRAGLADERSALWWEFHRVIEELHPCWVIIENVPGLRSSWSPTEPPPSGLHTGARWEVEETSDLETILAALAELGYGWAYRSIDAEYNGVAQQRERVFIAGYSGDVGRLERASSRQDISRLASLPVKVLFESESLRWDSAPSRETGQKVAAYTPTGFGEYSQHKGTLRNSGGDCGGGSEMLIAQSEPDIVKHALSSHNQRNDPDGEHFVIEAYQCHGGNVGPMGALRKGTGGLTGGIPFVFDWQSGGDVRLNVSEKHTSALQASQTPAVQDRYGVRRLTVTECERLMGFSDGHTAVNGMKDTPCYRMLGNAVCVPVAKWIGERIVAVAERPAAREKENDDA